MPLAFRGMRSRAVTGFVSKFTYRSAPHRSPAPQRVSDTQGVLPFAARGRRSAPRPPHGTARRCRPVSCVATACAARADPSLNTIENICYSRSWSGVAVHGRRMKPRETRARRRQYTRRKTYNLLPKAGLQ